MPHSRENGIIESQIVIIEFQQLSTHSQSCFIYTPNIFCCTVLEYLNQIPEIILLLFLNGQRPRRFRKAVSGRTETFHTLRYVPIWSPYRKTSRTHVHIITHTDTPENKPLAPSMVPSPTSHLCHLSYPIPCSLWKIHTHS